MAGARGRICEVISLSFEYACFIGFYSQRGVKWTRHGKLAVGLSMDQAGKLLGLSFG